MTRFGTNAAVLTSRPHDKRTQAFAVTKLERRKDLAKKQSSTPEWKERDKGDTNAKKVTEAAHTCRRVRLVDDILKRFLFFLGINIFLNLYSRVSQKS